MIEERADFGISSTDILLAREKGAPLVVLASIFQESAHILYGLERHATAGARERFA